MSRGGESNPNRIQSDDKREQFPCGRAVKDAARRHVNEIYLYVLNHNVQRVQFRAFFFEGRAGSFVVVSKLSRTLLSALGVVFAR